MSTLYKDEKDVEYDVCITQKDGNINLVFYADCGKFGTHEILDEVDLTPKQLLKKLQKNDTKNEDNILKLLVDFRNWTRNWAKYNEKLPMPEESEAFVKSLSEKFKVTCDT